MSARARSVSAKLTVHAGRSQHVAFTSCAAHAQEKRASPRGSRGQSGQGHTCTDVVRDVTSDLCGVVTTEIGVIKMTDQCGDVTTDPCEIVTIDLRDDVTTDLRGYGRLATVGGDVALGLRVAARVRVHLPVERPLHGDALRRGARRERRRRAVLSLRKPSGVGRGPEVPWAGSQGGVQGSAGARSFHSKTIVKTFCPLLPHKQVSQPSWPLDPP